MMLSMFVLWIIVFVGVFLRQRWVTPLAVVTIVLSVPTIIFAAYGMNLAPEGMPLSGSPFGFLIVVLFSIVLSVGVAVFFAKKKMF